MQGQTKLQALLERFDRREEQLLDALPLASDQRKRLSRELKYLREVRDQRIEQLLHIEDLSYATDAQELNTSPVGSPSVAERKRKRAGSLTTCNAEPGKRRETASTDAYYLPPELWCHVFSFLNRRQLLVTALVSTLWRYSAHMVLSCHD